MNGYEMDTDCPQNGSAFRALHGFAEDEPHSVAAEVGLGDVAGHVADDVLGDFFTKTEPN